MAHRFVNPAFSSTRFFACVVLGVAVVGGCDCSQDRTVPFGLDRDRGSNRRLAPPVETTHEPTEGQRFEGMVHTLAVEGVSIEFGSPLRALLAWDLDGDGDRDVLAVTETEGPDTRQAKLLHATRSGSTFADLRVLSQIDLPSSETAVDAHLATLSNGMAHATVRSDEGTWTWIVGLEASPRVYETIAATDSAIRLSFAAADLNEDGHPDLIANVDLVDTPPDEPSTEADRPNAVLEWLSSTSGLSPAPGQPETSLLAAAEPLLALAAEQPLESLAQSASVLALHRALCRESGEASIELSGVPGVACGPSSAAGRAAAARVIALSRRNRVGQALETARRLSDPAFRLSRSDRRRALAAIDRLVSTDQLRIRQGPTFVQVAHLPVHLGPVGFLDDDRIVVRGAQPRIWHLADETTALSEDGSLLLQDPSSRFSVSAIERGCRGYELVIHRTEDVAAGLVVGTPVSRPLIEAAGGLPCSEELSAMDRNDPGGWHILGWAPQGVVASNVANTVVVPLTLAGTPSGDAAVIAPRTAPPAPVAPGVMTARGERFAIVTEFGIFLRSLERDLEELVRLPEGSGNRLAPTAVAPSPNGRRIAFVAGGHVYMAERTDSP